MEVLRNYSSSVRFPVPDGLQAATYLVTRNGVQVGSTGNAEISNGVAKATIPYAASTTDGFLKVELTFTFEAVTHTQSKTVEVVTPYVEIYDVIEALGTDSEKARNAEAAARHVINAYCGQSFGHRKNQTLVVEGHGESMLRLPERLINVTHIDTLTARLDPKVAIIVSDGWYLKKGWSEVTAPLESDSKYWGYSSGVDERVGIDPEGEEVSMSIEKYGHGPVTFFPGRTGKSTSWKNDYPFSITGDWGYPDVPAAVAEAAALLINDYSCMEAVYRDRYIDSIRSADWRIEFNSQAWTSTGNVRADQLLSEFVLLDWAVV